MSQSATHHQEATARQGPEGRLSYLEDEDKIRQGSPRAYPAVHEQHSSHCNFPFSVLAHLPFNLLCVHTPVPLLYKCLYRSWGQYTEHRESRTLWTLQNGFHGHHDSNVTWYIRGLPLGCDLIPKTTETSAMTVLDKTSPAGAHEHEVLSL